MYIRFYILLTKDVSPLIDIDYVDYPVYAAVGKNDSNNYLRFIENTQINLTGYGSALGWLYRPNFRVHSSNNSVNTNFPINSNSNINSNGITLSKTQWTCLEHMVDTKAQTLHLYTNNTENLNMAITKINDWVLIPFHSNSPAPPPLPANWMPQLNIATIGYPYSNGYGMGDPFYVDDVVFASSRIGCLAK